MCVMCLGYATHLAKFGVTVMQQPNNKRRHRPKEKAIDGIPNNVNGQLMDQNSICASTKRGDNPWVLLDLKKAYLVSLVRVINFGTPGNNVAVRVGNSSNNGNDNYLCGNVQ